MSQQLFIPSKIKVGFVNRPGTYTGKLAYVIYFDMKGVLRKEKSWESWRDRGLAPVEYENEPTEGFVLNKGVGGARHSSGWNARNEYIRVYDPRDFEFEISVANLLFILREGNCSRGKGLEGKFVYSWHGTELVLLPVASQDYQNSAGFTKLQGSNVKAKDFINGATYVTKKQVPLIYLGRFDVFDNTYHYYHRRAIKYPSKQHVFWDEKKNEYQFMDGAKDIGAVYSDIPVPDYAERVEEFGKSQYGSRIVGLFTKSVSRTEPEHYYDWWVIEEQPGTFLLCESQGNLNGSDGKTYDYMRTRMRVALIDGKMKWESHYKYAYSPEYCARYPHTRNDSGMKYSKPTNLRLFAKMESGSEFLVSGSGRLENASQHKEEVANGQEN